MGYVKHKATTKSTRAMTGEVFEQTKALFLEQITKVVKLRAIPDSLIMNLNHTGIQRVPTEDWTFAAKGSKPVELAGLDNTRQVTATPAACLDGTFLPMQIFYQGTAAHSHPMYAFPKGFDIFHTPNHWANEETCLRFFKKIVFPYIKQK